VVPTTFPDHFCQTSGGNVYQAYSLALVKGQPKNCAVYTPGEIPANGNTNHQPQLVQPFKSGHIRIAYQELEHLPSIPIVCTWAQDERPADLHMAQPNVPVGKITQTVPT
jgi:hypothetical protein